jgi:hypothetical protein
MTNNGEHDASPSFDFPISTLFWKDNLGIAFSRQVGSAMRVRQTLSAFNLLAKRSAFPRGGRPQSRLFSLHDPELKQAPSGIVEIVGNELPILHAQRSAPSRIVLSDV